MDLLAQSDHLEHKEPLGDLEQPATQDQQDRLEHVEVLDHLDHLELMDSLVTLDREVILVCLGLLVHKVPLDSQVCLDQLDHKDHLEVLDQMDKGETLVGYKACIWYTTYWF